MNIAIYLRKSRAEEIESSSEETLRKHKEVLLEFSLKNSFNVLKIYEEVVSGENLYLRPQMLMLLSDVENNKYDGILCMDIDRLGRGSMSEQGIILETFKNSNTKIITPRKTYNLNNEMDEEYTEFQTFMARRELKIIKRRMQQGIIKSVLDGSYLSNAPYGYNNIIINKQPTLSVNEEESHFVQIIFDMYVKQGKGCQIIADYINSLGAKPRRSSKFCRTSIMHILKNQVYIGNIVWNTKTHKKGINNGINKYYFIKNPLEKWIITKGIHSPIIDKEIFFKAQEILNNKYHPPYYDGKISNQFAGIIKCKLCNHNMQRRVYKSKNITQYLCATKGCVKACNIDYIEEIFFKLIKKYMKNIRLKLGENKNKLQDKNTIYIINKQKDKLNKQREKIQELLELGVYTIETYTERNNSINQKIKELNSIIKSYNHKTNNKNSIPFNTKNLMEFYNLADIKTKNLILKEFISSATYYKAKDWAPNQFEMVLEIYDYFT